MESKVEKNGENGMTDLSTAAYSKALLSYVDILGFGEKIKASSEDKSKIAEIAALLSILKEISKAWPHSHRTPEGRLENIFTSWKMIENSMSESIKDERIKQNIGGWLLTTIRL